MDAVAIELYRDNRGGVCARCIPGTRRDIGLSDVYLGQGLEDTFDALRILNRVRRTMGLPPIVVAGMESKHAGAESQRR